MDRPTTDRGWAGFAARMFKTVKPERYGGRGLSGNRRFEAAFEGGYCADGRASDPDTVVIHLRAMVQTDVALAHAVLEHHFADKSGIVGLARIAWDSLQRQDPQPWAEAWSWREVPPQECALRTPVHA